MPQMTPNTLDIERIRANLQTIRGNLSFKRTAAEMTEPVTQTPPQTLSQSNENVRNQRPRLAQNDESIPDHIWDDLIESVTKKFDRSKPELMKQREREIFECKMKFVALLTKYWNDENCVDLIISLIKSFGWKIFDFVQCCLMYDASISSQEIPQLNQFMSRSVSVAEQFLLLICRHFIVESERQSSGSLSQQLDKICSLTRSTLEDVVRHIWTVESTIYFGTVCLQTRESIPKELRNLLELQRPDINRPFSWIYVWALMQQLKNSNALEDAKSWVEKALRTVLPSSLSRSDALVFANFLFLFVEFDSHVSSSIADEVIFAASQLSPVPATCITRLVPQPPGPTTKN
jgi:hypothetical protein